MPAKKEETKVEEVVEETKVEEPEFDVSDPAVLRPKSLPLIVKPRKGSKWKNKAQAEFAATLNGYAYKNPEKWDMKKEGLLETLSEIGKNPEELVKHTGNPGTISYGSNKLAQTAED